MQNFFVFSKDGDDFVYKECEIKLAIFDQIEWSWKIRKEKQKAFALI